MLDLVIRNANLADGRTGVDIAVQDGRIVEVAKAIAGSAREAFDATGQLVSPPFVDSHFHMDATLSLGLPRVNQSGTLLEGIALWGELKPLLTLEAVVERALPYCDWAVGKGLLAIRTHVDVCDDRLLAVEALLEVRSEDRALYRPAARRLPAGRRSPLDRVRREPQPRARPGRRRGRRHPAFRAHHGRRRGERAGALRDRRQARPAGRHALRRDATIRCRATSRRSPTRRSGSGCRAASPARISPPCIRWTTTMSRKLIPLMAEARAPCHRQSADQHHAAGPPRHLSEAPRHDARAGAAGRRHQRRLRPRLRDGSLVLPGIGRHARGGAHGPARRADDQPRGHARLLSMR